MNEVKTTSKTVLKILSGSVVLIVITLLTSELSLRLLGSRIAQTNIPPSYDKMHEMQPERGWVLKPGKYIFQSTDLSPGKFTVNLDEKYGRITSLPTAVYNTAQQPLFIGCSFAYGRGLSDEDHLAWKTQEKLSQFHVDNRTLSGYSDLQALQALEEALTKTNKPRIEIYGPIDHHRLRNIAHRDWLHVLRTYNRELTPAVPYITIHENAPTRNSPIKSTTLPHADKFVFVNKLDKALLHFQSKNRDAKSFEINLALIKEMSDKTNEAGGEFYTAILEMPEKKVEPFVQALHKNHIQYIDTNLPLNSSNTIKHYGHPNEYIHSAWAEIISNRLIKDGF